MFAVHHTRRPEPGILVSTLFIALALSIAPAHAAAVKIAWNPVPETGLQGYRIHLGTASHTYTVTHDTSQTTFEVPDLDYGKTYYLAVSVFGATGQESLYSEEITVELAIPPAPSEILVNGSFEAGTTGWTTTGNQTVQSAAPYLPTDGANIVAFNASNLPPNAVISQTFSTAVGETYVLGFDAGVLAFNTSAQTLAVNVSGSANLVSQSITILGTGGGTNRWQPQTFSFVADSTTTTLAFQDQSLTTNSIDLLLDNVKLTGPAAPPIAPADPPTIGTPSLTGSPGSMVISLRVAAAGTYALQRSTDLIQWEQVAETELLEPGNLEFHDTTQGVLPEPPVPALFYRIGSTAFASGNP